MSLKKHLNTEAIQKKKDGQKVDEIAMFESLRNYFANKTDCAIIKTHSLPVKFNEDKIQCESSDLMIVSYSKHRHCCIKVTLLQAKLAQQQNDLPDIFKFHLDTNQYLLLKECPVINPMQTRLPSNILSDSCSPSITSYGVFYEYAKSWNFAFEITQLLKPRSPITRKTTYNSNKVCYFDTTKDIYGWQRWRHALDYSLNHCWHPCPICYHHYYHGIELLSTISADTFEKALMQFKIGSPLCFREGANQISKIVGVIKRATAIGRASEEVVNNFVSYISEYIGNNDNNNNNFEGDDRDVSLNPSYILLVNADNEN